MAASVKALADNAENNAIAAEERALDAGAAKTAAQQARDKAQEWAESPAAPGGVGTKSAKSHAQDAADAKNSAWAAAAAAGEGAGLPSPLIPGKVLGAVTADTVGWVDPGLLVTLDGPVEVAKNRTGAYTITNYNAFSDYIVQVSDGSVSLSGDKINFTPPDEEGEVDLTVTIDGAPQLFSIGILPVQNDYIPTPAPTPALGSSFEGGFYLGMLWNQLMQSATSTTIDTGLKAFAVPDMSGTPLVYEGQILEIRSRADPSKKMVGAVVGAVGTDLFVNVTSVVGSGTYSDWSVMATYRQIFAPKASGENASIALKNDNSALPPECQTLTEGWLATEAMKSAGNATVYPAAHWARSLVIGGFADFHIPARDALELAWRNGKPTMDANYTTADRPTGASFDYKSLGSYGDTSNAHGTNNNSAPAGAAYTSSVPAQTGIAAFKSGGAEAFEYGSSYYWSCSEYSATGAWIQSWYSSSPGSQNVSYKPGAYRLRACRRSII